jgi:error-prone DNA polymerase
VAIVRPGPITGGAVHPYLERRKLLRADPDYEVPYAHPLLKEVLADTLGSIVFQDQVIEVARAMADFTPSEGEGLRRAMSRKRSHEALAAYHLRFVEGAAANGVSEEVAESVFAQIIGFSGFGFPKAHAAAFGLLAYQTSWLRAHYAPEFVCGLMNEQPMGFYLPDALAHEAQRRGIQVLPADVNKSGVECSVEWIGDELAVRVGLAYVKGAKEAGLRSLVAARAEAGPFKSVEDLASRSGTDGPTLEKLAWAGACDYVGAGTAGRNRREALWLLGAAPAGETKADDSAQLALPIAPLPVPKLNKLDDWDEMIADYGATGMTVGRHPMALLRDRLKTEGVSASTDLERLPENHRVTVSGLVVARQRPGTAKGVVFVLLEDELGVVNVILPPQIYTNYRAIVRSEPLLTVHGKLERRTGAVNVLATSVKALLGADIEAAVREIKRPNTSEQDLRAKMGIDTDTALAAMNGDFDAARKVMGDAADIRAVAPVGINFGRRGR